MCLQGALLLQLISGLPTQCQLACSPSYNQPNVRLSLLIKHNMAINFKSGSRVCVEDSVELYLKVATFDLSRKGNQICIALNQQYQYHNVPLDVWYLVLGYGNTDVIY